MTTNNEYEFELIHQQLYDGYVRALQCLRDSEFPEPEMEAVVASYEKYMVSRISVCQLYYKMDWLESDMFYKRGGKSLNGLEN